MQQHSNMQYIRGPVNQPKTGGIIMDIIMHTRKATTNSLYGLPASSLKQRYATLYSMYAASA